MNRLNERNRILLGGGRASEGFTLVEVMMSLVVLSVGLLGAMGMMQWTERSLQQSLRSSRALSLAEARMEIKQSGLWERLLIDDMDQDGVPDMAMQDDGLQEDLTAGDGIFTADTDQDGIHLVWTVEPNRTGPFTSAGMVWIDVRARYETQAGRLQEIHLRSMRANPRYTGGM
ncbi:MAG TPA: prepilin-type N-terminal cleavage/methylation domain-containing protein [Nitrospiraceae bacterium]|nr:prepilin-type N-terminal cleavage/methylation domain-containing protein [Nitrospiraceae bacterium]